MPLRQMYGTWVPSATHKINVQLKMRYPHQSSNAIMERLPEPTQKEPHHRVSIPSGSPPGHTQGRKLPPCTYRLRRAPNLRGCLTGIWRVVIHNLPTDSQLNHLNLAIHPTNGFQRLYMLFMQIPKGVWPCHVSLYRLLIHQCIVPIAPFCKNIHC